MRRVWVQAWASADLGGEEEVGYFHEWAGLSENPLAIVELKDGRVITARHTGVRFLKPGEEPPNDNRRADWLAEYERTER